MWSQKVTLPLNYPTLPNSDQSGPFSPLKIPSAARHVSYRPGVVASRPLLALSLSFLAGVPLSPLSFSSLSSLLYFLSFVYPIFLFFNLKNCSLSFLTSLSWSANNQKSKWANVCRPTSTFMMRQIDLSIRALWCCPGRGIVCMST